MALRSREEQLDRNLAVVPVTTTALALPAYNSDTSAYARGVFLTDSSGNPVDPAIGAFTNPAASVTRPADTTAYASGDLLANSTTAASVVALQFTVGRIAAGSFMLRRLKLTKSTASLTNASFRLHLFLAQPATITNGDNGAFSVSGVAAGAVGRFDVTMDQAYTDGAAGWGVPINGFDMSIKLAAGQVLYGLIEVRGAYTPGSAEIFTATLDDLQN